jgi:hypothetical protein
MCQAPRVRCRDPQPDDVRRRRCGLLAFFVAPRARAESAARSEPHATARSRVRTTRARVDQSLVTRICAGLRRRGPIRIMNATSDFTTGLRTPAQHRWCRRVMRHSAPFRGTRSDTVGHRGTTVTRRERRRTGARDPVGIATSAPAAGCDRTNCKASGPVVPPGPRSRDRRRRALPRLQAGQTRGKNDAPPARRCRAGGLAHHAHIECPIDVDRRRNS